MEQFLETHQAQLVAAHVPQHLWPVLYYKLTHDLLDAGEYFFLARDEDGDLHVVVRDDVDLAAVQPESDEALFLVDHAWTFTAEQCLDQLSQSPPLLQRMENLLQIELDEDEDERSTAERTRVVLDQMWKYANTYRLGHLSPAEVSAIWYIMDEFGSAIEHDDDAPNMRMVPFYFGETQCAFSLLWPVASLEAGDFLTRDFLPQTSSAHDQDMRAALLAALFYPTASQTEAEVPELYVEALKERVALRQKNYSLEETRAKYCAIVSQTSETLSDPATTVATPSLTDALADPEPLRIYSNLPLVRSNLKHDKFAHVEQESDAQVLWATRHLKDFQKYASDARIQIINQFPNEKILTCKDLLYETCKLQNGGVQPSWLAKTFNMATEFPELVAEYIRRDQAIRAASELDIDVDTTTDTDADADANHWICKPWNMARSIDTCIAQNAAHLARLTETGPKIACQYIHRPVLIDSRKFDFRFLVMVKSTEPLELYLSGVSWLRIANSPFAMDDFSDFQKHFTVMNYSKFDVRIMDNTEFVSRFENEYPSEDWAEVHAQICSSIKELFTLVTAQPPPMGLGRCDKSRALYGVDVMLTWVTDAETGQESIRPMILEVNFQPDCTRACKYFPSFYSDLMNVLVLDKKNEVVHGVTKL